MKWDLFRLRQRPGLKPPGYLYEALRTGRLRRLLADMSLRASVLQRAWQSPA
jgi:hypothetical protein